MKHAVIGFTLALLAAAASVSQAAEGTQAGSVENASLFANGQVATIVAVGLGAATALAVAVVGASDNGTATTATATATATTR
ncbi:MAG: hypothetical protein NVS9B10_05130 [Nevskia sp.]